MNDELKRYPYVLPPDRFWPTTALALAFVLGLLVGFLVCAASAWCFA